MKEVSSSLLPSQSRPARCAADLLLAWPREQPLAALISGGACNAQNQWSILARPSETIVLAAADSREGTLAALDAALARTPRASHEQRHPEARPDALPFTGGWLLALGYALAESFEDRVVSRHRATREAPRAVLHWCDDAWCFHHASQTVHPVGNPPPLTIDAARAPWTLHELTPQESDSHYASKVDRALAYIHAGDVYQANIARRFDANFSGCVRSFAHAAITTNGSWFGALMDLPHDASVVSMSPELFVRIDATGHITTRPIKGTRPSEVHAAELLDSAKDAAELAMIVDLMRSDLGRIAEVGSVRVTDGRFLETHHTVHHGVAEICAQLRSNTTWLDVLRATFPPGSVTGAPKVRAMQVIDELESTQRGFYCGAMGFISRSGTAAFNVAIRTAQLSAKVAPNAHRKLCYHAGCGIVAESEAVAEVAETHAKVRALSRLTPSSRSMHD